MAAARPRPADGDRGRPSRAKETSRIPHGILWNRGLLLAEAEIGTAGPTGGRWARAAAPDVQVAFRRRTAEADNFEEGGTRSLAA